VGGRNHVHFAHGKSITRVATCSNTDSILSRHRFCQTRLAFLAGVQLQAAIEDESTEPRMLDERIAEMERAIKWETDQQMIAGIVGVPDGDRDDGWGDDGDH